MQKPVPDTESGAATIGDVPVEMAQRANGAASTNGETSPSMPHPSSQPAGMPSPDFDPDELQEWFDSLDYILDSGGPEHAHYLLRRLDDHARKRGAAPPFTANTPYINTIPAEQQGAYPGSREIERRIKSIVRWNAMAMVVRANKTADNIGGHISTFA